VLAFPFEIPHDFADLSSRRDSHVSVFDQNVNRPKGLRDLINGPELGVMRSSATLMELSTDQSNSRYENSRNSHPKFRVHERDCTCS